MKILFLHPPWPGKGYGIRSQQRWPRKRGDKGARYPVYLCYVATLLKEKGFDVKYIDGVMQDLTENNTLDMVAGIKPNIVYIESTTPTINYDKYIVEKIKERLPNVICIFAGSHPTFFSKEVLENSKVDIIVRGEQDYTALETVQALKANRPLETVKGISWKDKKGKIIENPKRELIQSLDELPFPDRKLIPHQWYVEAHAVRRPFTFVMASRGCPNRCTFCLWPSVYFEGKVRFRSVENIAKELKWLVKEYGMREVFFDDSTFNVTKERVIAISKSIIENDIKILWGCSCRVDKVDEEMLHYMKKSGCRIICYGPESSSEKTLRRISKGINIKQAYKAIKLTKKAGIIAHANFMVGFPWETKKDLYNTIEFAKNLEPDTIQISLCYPHPGSKMYEEAIRNNWFDSNIVGNWDRWEMVKGPVLKTNMPAKELQLAISRANTKFFFRPSYIIKTIYNIRSIDELKRVLRGVYTVIKGKIIYNLKDS